MEDLIGSGKGEVDERAEKAQVSYTTKMK